MNSQDPNATKNWTARFISSSGNVLATERYQEKTLSEAHDAAQEKANKLGSRCDDYHLTEDSK